MSLDDEILKEADQIRRERHSKKVRAEAKAKAQAHAEAEAKLTAAHAPLRVPGHGIEVVPTLQDDEGVVMVNAMSKSTRHEDNSVMVGNLIGEDHVNYVLMYNMLTGIRIGVSALGNSWRALGLVTDFHPGLSMRSQSESTTDHGGLFGISQVLVRFVSIDRSEAQRDFRI